MRLKDSYYIRQNFKNISLTESEYQLLERENWGSSGNVYVLLTGDIETIEEYCRKYDLLLETSKSI